MNTNSSALVSAWDALPGDPAIANYGEPILLRGTKVTLSEYQAFTEDEKLEALNNLIGSKHCLVLAPSDCGCFVPISQMDTDKLIFSAKFKARNENSAIIDDEILPVFDELVTLLNDVEASVSAQALEDIQDMVFDQTLRKLSKGVLKFFYFYLDDLMECLVMIVGNRQIISFDVKKIRAFQNKNQPILEVAPNKPKAPRAKKAGKPKPKKASSESSSEPESESSSSSSSSSSEDGLVPDGQVTPVFSSKPSAPVLLGNTAASLSAASPTKPSAPILSGNTAASLPAASLSAAQAHARDTLAAQKCLLEAQQRVAALAAVAINFQSQPAHQSSGSPVASLQPVYHIPKKAALDKSRRSSSSKLSKRSKHSRRSSKKSKKSSRHAKKARHARKHKDQSSGSSSSSPESSSESESDSPPQKEDPASQV